ncbi:S-layer homology domain-containing protein [Dialister invisus]|uniref:S-layer homology domain-containing protein n=1 Tax=Dialister invisus TaxID=218538 RepID=UPI0028EFA076|nr:S-layer homology domain-containing protein [Dialister invisus]
MNKIYSIIWSKARNTYVVTSEFARKHTKSKAMTKAALIVLFAAANVMTANVNAFKDPAATSSGFSDTGVAIGQSASVDINSVAIGEQSSVSNSAGNSVAIGPHVAVDGDDSIAIGAAWESDRNKGYGRYRRTTVQGSRSMAIGGGDTAVVGNNNMALGAGAMVGFNKSQYNKDFSLNANGVVNSVALGVDSEATASDAVAIGYASLASTAGGIAGYNPTTQAAATDTSAVWKSTKGAVSIGNAVTNDTRQITNLAAGTKDSDAVNVAQLKAVQAAATTTVTSNNKSISINKSQAADGHNNYDLSVTTGTLTTNTDGSVTAGADTNVTGATTSNSYATVNDVANAINNSGFTLTTSAVTGGSKVSGSDEMIKSGGKIDMTAGKNLTVKQEANGKVTYALADTVTGLSSITAGNTTIDTNGVTVNGNTYLTDNGINANNKKITNIADGDISPTSKDAVNGSQLHNVTNSITTVLGGNAQTTTDGNVTMTNIGNTGANTINEAIQKAYDKEASVIAGSTNVVVTNANKNASGGTEYVVDMARNLSLDSVTTGNTKIDTNGVTVNGNTYLTDNGINANDKKITNVSDGDLSPVSTDAVNGRQLYQTNQNVSNLTTSVDKLGNRLNKVGAGAAALAGLHPLDFDPDDKWTFAAGYGNYKNANAMAIGAFYRPNEDTMFSVAGSLGNGENMINAGISVKLGQKNNVSTTRVAMAREMADMSRELKAIREQNNVLLQLLNPNKTFDFPDVPENHWAYEYIRTLAGNGILQGYPDGTFKGDRSMTRYEFATLVYKALQNGVKVNNQMDRLMIEFEPELRAIRLDHIRVDRISGKDNDRHKVERVRVNNEKNTEIHQFDRDIYGSHIQPQSR